MKTGRGDFPAPAGQFISDVMPSTACSTAPLSLCTPRSTCFCMARRLLWGAIIPAGAEVILYMGAEKSDELCTVPNVVGLSADEANRSLVNAGLIMKATGAAGSGVKVISQSLASGEEAAAGTVVTVQMGQMTDIDEGAGIR